MALVSKSGGGRVRGSTTSVGTANKDSSRSQKGKSSTPRQVEIELPDGPYEPEYDVGIMTIFIHGEQGIGKTSFASEFEDAIFLMCEPGGKFLRIARIPKNGQFTEWKQLIKAIDLIVASDKYSNVVIDTADIAYELCTHYVCGEANEDWINEGTLGYGKGYDKVDAKFKEQILRITGSGRGVIFISHTKSQDFERATGVKYSKLIATIKDRGRRFLHGFVDITGYYGYFGEDRYLVIQGNEGVDAKCRVKGRFLTTKGKPVFSIPMGESSEESFENFMTAFNNKQIEQYPMGRKAVISEVKAKFDRKK